MIRKQLLLFSIVLLFVSGCSLGNFSGNSPVMRVGQLGQREQTVAVEVEPVMKGDLIVTKKIIGEIVTEEREVFAETAGKLDQLHVHKGERVTQGQLLANIDTTNHDEAILRAEISVESAKQQLQQAIISQKQLELSNERLAQLSRQLEEAEKNLEEEQYLYEQGVISLSERNQAEKQVQEAYSAYEQELVTVDIDLEKAQLSKEQAELNVVSAEVSLQETIRSHEETSGKAAIYAPIAGEVRAVHHLPGEQISTQQSLLTIMDERKTKITTQITAEQKALLPIGQEVSIITAQGDKPLAATVDYVSGAINGSGFYEVELLFSTEDAQLSSGEFVQLAFSEIIEHDKLLVPTQAILNRADANYVYIVEDGKAVQKQVEIINSQTEQTAIQGDIEMGSLLIVNGHKLVADGMNVLLPGQELPTVQPEGSDAEGRGVGPRSSGSTPIQRGGNH